MFAISWCFHSCQRTSTIMFQCNLHAFNLVINKQLYKICCSLFVNLLVSLFVNLKIEFITFCQTFRIRLAFITLLIYFMYIFFFNFFIRTYIFCTICQERCFHVWRGEMPEAIRRPNVLRAGVTQTVHVRADASTSSPSLSLTCS